MTAIPLGDMTIVGRPPPKLLKALAVIVDRLHPTFARERWIVSPQQSKESCVLCSLAVRDFLISIGFIDAQVRAVVTMMLATKNGKTLHSLGIGAPPGGLNPEPRRWNGHMVVTTSGFLIDTTLYRMRRKQWPDLSGMLTLPLDQSSDPKRFHGLKGIAAAQVAGRNGLLFEIGYLDNPGNVAWAIGGDAREAWRRDAVIKAMRKRFGEWIDASARAP